MNNEISKAMKFHFLKNRINRNRDLYRKQRNLCDNLLRKL